MSLRDARLGTGPYNSAGAEPEVNLRSLLSGSFSLTGDFFILFWPKSGTGLECPPQSCKLIIEDPEMTVGPGFVRWCEKK